MAPYLDPINQAFIDAGAKAGGPPLHELPFIEARNVLEGLQEHKPASDVTTEDIEVTAGSSGTVKTVIYKPANAKGELPIALYTHGGGWILGSPQTHDRLVRDLVRESGAALVFPYYTPAPDAQFPVQFEQSYAVLEYIWKNGRNHGLKTNKIALIGDSAGGHMAIAMSYLSSQRSGPPIAYQVLFYPVTDTSRESSTFTTFKDGPYLSVPLLKWMEGSFLPNDADRKTALGSPLLMGTQDLAKMPPTLIITCSVDPLQAEGEEFGHRLQQAGVDAAVFRADGVIHDFVLLNATAGSATGVAAVELAALKLRKALA